jgi:hypothetical protein
MIGQSRPKGQYVDVLVGASHQPLECLLMLERDAKAGQFVIYRGKHIVLTRA